MRSSPETKSKRKRARKTKLKFERYELIRSPLAQNPNQRDICKLLRASKGELDWLIDNKDRFTVRELKQA